ncbi:ribosomal protein L31 [human gut metagenome]
MRIGYTGIKNIEQAQQINDKNRRGEIMREGIHPDYYQAKVVCNCGNEFVTGSTKEEIHVEICSKCHPFYTGQQKASSTRGRIDKFNKKYGVSNN